MKHLEKYYEGKGCKCEARSSNECGCHDVDWTPKAVYVLRAERDSLQIALEEISNLAKTLKTERDEARDETQKSKAYKRVLKETNARLKRERDEAREAAHSFRSSYYASSGKNKGGCAFPWEGEK